MKIFLILFVLLFSSSVFADDISDFQIEGMSIGDSLLDYMSEEEILNNKEDWYADKTYAYTAFRDINFLKTYDQIGFFYKEGDEKYKILSISGIILCVNNVDDCYKKQKEIDQELSELFKKAIKHKETFIYPDNVQGFGTNSKAKQIFYDFNSGDGIVIETKDWGTDSEFMDNLSVNIDTEEIQDWIRAQY